MVTNDFRRPYEWGAVVNWTLSLFLMGLTTTRTPFGSGMDKFALGLFSGIVWAAVGGLIVAAWKYFKQSPLPDRVKVVESTKVNDKALFIVSMVVAAFLSGKALYLETYGAFVDALILLALGFGVRAGLPVASGLFAMYAFVTPILVVANGGGGAVIWPFIFFYVCRSLLSQHNGRIVVDTDSHRNAPPLQPVATEDTDLALYKLAADELNSNSGARNEALWYKAFADASGDEQATMAGYIRLRVDQLRRRADVATASASLSPADLTPSNTQATQAVAPSSTPINFWVLGISVFLVIGIVTAIIISADDDMKKELKVAQPSNPVPSAPKWEDLSDTPPPQKPTSKPSNSSLDVSDFESFLKQQEAAQRQNDASMRAAKHAESLTRAQIKQIEEIAQTIATQHNANSKAFLDEMTISNRAIAIGRNVRLEYVLRVKKGLPPTKLKEFSDETRREILPKACQQNANNPAFDRGLYYTFAYINTYGEKLAEFNVDKATCLHQ